MEKQPNSNTKNNYKKFKNGIKNSWLKLKGQKKIYGKDIIRLKGFLIKL